MYKRFIKRPFDLLLSSFALILLSPLYLALYIWGRKEVGKPVFFKQERSTKNSRSFFLYKFRSMTNELDSNGNLLPDEKRLTKFGHFLRNTSLDELPEIWNIFKGDMSIIGPRPLQTYCNEYFKDYEKNRFNVRGGLIPPEVMQSNSTPTWDEQLKWEADYALNCTFLNDCKILFAVFNSLFNRSKADYGSYVRKSLKEERKKS